MIRHAGEDQVGELIPSPSNDDPLTPPCYICPECVAVCNSILDDPRGNWEEPGSTRNSGEAPAAVNTGTPHVVHDKVTTVHYSAGWSGLLKFRRRRDPPPR
jgi:hypothetical protein